MSMQIEVSYGEVLDKITILEIKAARIADPGKRSNVRRELALLTDAWARAVDDRRIATARRDLKRVNECLWEIEDHIRLKEAAGVFDAEFIELARRIYFTNDERARIKRQINAALGSTIMEEKSYEDYGA